MIYDIGRGISNRQRQRPLQEYSQVAGEGDLSSLVEAAAAARHFNHATRGATRPSSHAPSCKVCTAKCFAKPARRAIGSLAALSKCISNSNYAGHIAGRGAWLSVRRARARSLSLSLSHKISLCLTLSLSLSLSFSI